MNEDDYFSRLICEDITEIARDIKESHHRDAETGDANNPLTDVIDVEKEYATATDPMKATLTTLSKQLGMNFIQVLLGGSSVFHNTCRKLFDRIS